MSFAVVSFALPAALTAISSCGLTSCHWLACRSHFAGALEYHDSVRHLKIEMAVGLVNAFKFRNSMQLIIIVVKEHLVYIS